MKISIITINYNDADGLRKTIESVASQTCLTDVEYIVVDGASSDGSVDVIRENETVVTKWVSEKDTGIYNAMNKGTAMASGDYCLFLNSGDSFHDSTVVERALPLLDGAEFLIGKDFYLNSGAVTDNSAPLSMLRFYSGSIPHQATFIRRDVMAKYGYDESYRIVSDWKFFVQSLILDNLPYKFIDLVVADYDCTGISSTQKAKVDIERAKVYEELFPPRVMSDYLKFVKGSNYSDTDYDRFFVKLRDFRSAKLIYSLDVLLMRFAAIFKKGLAFVKEYPIKLPRE